MGQWSHGWLTREHPDPHGTTLAAVRRHLREHPDAIHCGLFWDFASLPQKGEDGTDRTAAEKEAFGRGLDCMAVCYASITGTAVLVYKDIVIPDGATSDYNRTPYDGKGGRGWCIFEQGVSMTAAATLSAAVREATALPERFARAQASRPKVIDIGGGASVPREVTEDAGKVLAEAVRLIGMAKFTGKADEARVPQMLAEFEWKMHTAVVQATTDYASSGLSVDPRLLQPHMPVVSIRSGPSSRKSAAAAQEREERPTNALVEFQDRARWSVFTRRGSLIRDESTTAELQEAGASHCDAGTQLCGNSRRGPLCTAVGTSGVHVRL